MSDSQKTIDIVVRKNGNQYLAYHPGSGVTEKGQDLNAIYAKVESKVSIFLQDMEKLGMSDMALNTLNFETSSSNKKFNKRSFVTPLLFVFIFMVALFSAANYFGKKADQRLKTFETEFKATFENPTPEQTRDRIEKLNKTLKASEPYLIEIKKFWNELPAE